MTTTEFIVFLDPLSGLFYSYSEQMGILIRENPPESFERFIAEDLKYYKTLRGQKFTDQLCSYQTRPMPLSFLIPRKYRFPVYSTQQPIYQAILQQFKFRDDALAKNQHKEFISVRVYFGSIREQLRQAKNRKMNDQYIDCVDIKFIASVNEIIRTVCRLILQQQRIVITTNSANSRLILKVRNRQEYMYGNEPISSYNCVLECLKQDKILEVEIVQADINKGREQFNKFIFTRKVDDVENNVFEGFKWKDLVDNEHCGFFMWHMPDAYFMDSKYIESLNQSDPSEIQVNKNKIRVKIAEKRKQLRTRMPRFLIKESMQVFIQKRRTQIEKKLVSIEGTTIYSGECAFVYTFQIVGIKNLLNLLQLSNPSKRKTKKGILKLTNNKQQGEENITNFQTATRRYNKILQIKKQGKFPIIPYQFNVVVNFFCNGTKIAKQKSPMALVSNTVETDFKIHWKSLSNLMLQTSIVFKIKFYSKQGEKITCGIGVIKVFDEFGFLRQGKYKIQLQAHEDVNRIKLGCYSHELENDPRIAVLYVNFPKFKNPVRWTLNDIKCMSLIGYIETKSNEQIINVEEKMSELMKLLSYDPLKMMSYTQYEKRVLKLGKKYYKHQSDKLINYLYSVDWANPIDVAQAYMALKTWAPLKPVQAMFLMNPRISDQKVRYFAVKTLDQMKNYQFCLYANQLTQALVSFETHQNPLIDLIIERCCQDPFNVAQEYFWQFYNRLNQRITCYRFTLYLQTLILTSPIRKQFWKQIKTNEKMVKYNQSLIKNTEGWQFYKKNENFISMVKVIESQLLNIDPDMNGFSFPLRPERIFKRLIPESSKMFDSKKLPFALACTSKSIQQYLKNEQKQDKKKKQKPEYMIMFKYGDDIKQDHLVLQIFTIFNKIWVEAGFDLKMNIYKVLSTGDGIGFIEIVQNAQNSSYIHKEYSDNLMEALDDRSTYKFLKSMNEDEEKFKIARENFIRSSAGYLVATYIMGIGDRHSGNYMIQKNGKFFHIDFGHILGNFKMKLGIKRERTPFVFTSEFSYVMGGEKSNAFARFEVTCANAYNALRKNANLIINLLVMIVGSQIPQIQCYEHLQYAIDKLNLDMSDMQASQHIVKQIKKTLESESRKYDNWVHERMRIG